MNKKPFMQMSILISVLVGMCAFLVAAEAGTKQIPLSLLLLNALEFLLAALCSAIVVLALFWAFDWWKKHPSFGAVETRFQLFLCNRRKALAQKNAAQIIPALQPFFYLVLRRNKAVLGIDPGPDCGSLSPNGRLFSFRNNALLYIFELVMSTPPEQDSSTLKQLLNQCIFAELTNYGIANLPGYFVSSKNQAYPSVYLDRLDYDEVRHMLIFEVLFVGSDQAAAALEKAWERDKPQAAKAEPEVFADEI